ncbi:conserved hypothetical protein [Sporisorium reilianum SRZ2]|uniref:Uncharacterized protein n=1 Tax=Sporisorium reilianum (strain SRZ2) TaxID=999809 RepID=E6ZZX4_SPORE|nr:conserved hypothetical protein [Sporisorium reilianum SRZ2]
MITAPRYPAPARTDPQEPMLVVARIIITAIPLHRRTASTFSSASSSSTTSSTLSLEEKAPLLPASVKKASHTILNYGTMLKHARSESRKAQLKQSISRPISHESQWFEHAEDTREQEPEKQAEMERSVGSIYSTRTWETEGELSRDGGAFQYDDVETSRSSVQTFASSERSYTFF